MHCHVPYACHTSKQAEAAWIGAIALERPTSVLIDAPNAAARRGDGGAGGGPMWNFRG